jgi:N-acyl-D-aspartate/D-glutamate deacylase
MPHDLVIRAGTVADGTGEPTRTADVAIDDGIVVEVGRVGRGKREIDADGALVTPGFVDIHTHYDGQATWDSRFQPSSAHGVTTVVMGNCGVGFAPCRPADHGALIELMEGVEDIPGAVLNEGLPWTWETFDEYLDVLESVPHDLDFATQACHVPIRLWVMGQRGADRERATSAEIEAMGQLAAAAIESGALGFSTSRTKNHKTSKGAFTASLDAAREELVGIAEAVGATGKGMLQVVADMDDFDDELTTFHEMMRASGRPLVLSVGQFAPGDGHLRRLEAISQANEQGMDMVGVVATRAIGVTIAIDGSANPWAASPTFRAVAANDDLVALHQADVKRRILEETEAAGGIRYPLDRVFSLAEIPDYEPAAEQSIAARAEREQRDAADVLYDLLLDGPAYYPVVNYWSGDLDEVETMLTHPHAVPGLGDGGAHVSIISDASFPTTLLAHWGRDRRRGDLLDVAWLVSRHTSATAATVGLLDRGLLVPGYKGDVNVIDFDNLAAHRPRIVGDLPAGGKRVMQSADGYVHTFVSGVEVYASGEATEELPGRLVRGAQPAPE